MIGQNITRNTREMLYKAILSKHIGWHDDPLNASGVLSSILSNECNVLNGVSTEALAATIDSTFTLLSALLIGFYYCWQISVTALAAIPLLMLSSVIGAK